MIARNRRRLGLARRARPSSLDLPVRQGRDGPIGSWMPAMLGGTAAALFLLDPEQGRRRRARIRDRLASAVRVLPDALAVTARDTTNRASGAAATAVRTVRRGHVDDVVLEERVRSALGRAAGHTGALTVSANHGRIVLSGVALTSEADEIVAATRRAPGVRDVEDRGSTAMGADPKQPLDDDLDRFKSLLEAGKTTADGHETRIRELQPEPAGAGRSRADIP